MFWIAAALITAACLAVVLVALRARPVEGESDVAVYRDQLRELDRDVARGTLTADEAEAARTEVARRLLSADQAKAAPRSVGPTVLAAGITVAVVLPAAFGTYLLIGAPGYPDLPLTTRIALIEEERSARPGQEVAEGELPRPAPPPNVSEDNLAMAQQLRDVLADRPDDLEGWRLRVRIEGGLNDTRAAWRAQNRVIAILGDDATAQDFAVLAELMILAADGYVSPEAELALEAALQRDPTNGSARYYLGLMYAQGGRADRAWPIWRRLVADSGPEAPWLPPIYQQIERVSALAGDATPLDQLPQPAQARGPSASDIEAAGEMSMEERMEMISGMVSGLAERLATDGGPPGDWARLISAYGVLGRTDAAAAVYAEAQLAFAENPGALDTLKRAAERAGLSP